VTNLVEKTLVVGFGIFTLMLFIILLLPYLEKIALFSAYLLDASL
jgi:hypothetical protein